MKPPYSSQYVPQRGLEVALGCHAWTFAKRQYKAVLVLPMDRDPAEFMWPAEQYGAVIHETGSRDDERLDKLAGELLKAGNPHVVALRHSLAWVPGADPRVFYYSEAQRAAA